MKLSHNFSREEMKCNCNCCEHDTVDVELLVALQDLRDHFNSPVTITSGNRCPIYNESIGGAENSYHTLGRAADIQVKDVAPLLVQQYLEEKYRGRFGIGRYKKFTHLDTRTGQGRWNG